MGWSVRQLAIARRSHRGCRPAQQQANERARTRVSRTRAGTTKSRASHGRTAPGSLRPTMAGEGPKRYRSDEPLLAPSLPSGGLLATSVRSDPARRAPTCGGRGSDRAGRPRTTRDEVEEGGASERDVIARGAIARADGRVASLLRRAEVILPVCHRSTKRTMQRCTAM